MAAPRNRKTSHRSNADLLTTAHKKSKKPNARGRYFVEALGRGLSLLDCFVEGPAQITLGELSARIGANKVTTFRILRTLEESGYVRQEPQSKCYQLSLKMLDLQEASLVALEYPLLAQPFLEDLHQLLGESVSMAVLEGTDVRYVARASASALMAINLHVGSVLPAHATSMGKVLLAALGVESVKALYKHQTMQAFTPKTITTMDRLLRELATVEQNGYGAANEELEKGLLSVAAPIRTRRGQVVAAINSSVSIARVTHDKLIASFVPPLIETAARISARLGLVSHTFGV
jgi:IclR family pca regulon transcriptional regulator